MAAFASVLETQLAAVKECLAAEHSRALSAAGATKPEGQGPVAGEDVERLRTEFREALSGLSGDLRATATKLEALSQLSASVERAMEERFSRELEKERQAREAAQAAAQAAEGKEAEQKRQEEASEEERRAADAARLERELREKAARGEGLLRLAEMAKGAMKGQIGQLLDPVALRRPPQANASAPQEAARPAEAPPTEEEALPAAAASPAAQAASPAAPEQPAPPAAATEAATPPAPAAVEKPAAPTPPAPAPAPAPSEQPAAPPPAAAEAPMAASPGKSSDGRSPLEVALELASTTKFGMPSVDHTHGRPMWIVVGGAESGGILVRQGSSTKSTEYKIRLKTGTKVEQMDVQGKRLHYRRLRGDGPDFGWVSIEGLNGKRLMEELDEEED